MSAEIKLHVKTASTFSVFKSTYLYFAKFYCTTEKRPWSAKLKPCRTAPFERSKLLRAIPILWLVMWRRRERTDKTWQVNTWKPKCKSGSSLMGLVHWETKQSRGEILQLYLIYLSFPVISNMWGRLELLLREAWGGVVGPTAELGRSTHEPAPLSTLWPFAPKKDPKNAMLEKSHSTERAWGTHTSRRHQDGRITNTLHHSQSQWGPFLA